MLNFFSSLSQNAVQLVSSICFIFVNRGGAMLSKFRFLVVVTVAATLTACGGGGSVDDGTVELTVTPAEVVLTSAGCAGSGVGPKVMVFGGVEPYTIHNPFPAHIRLSSSYVANAGDSFDVTVLGGACLDAIPLTITDGDTNTVTVSITHSSTSN
ncbi:MAG: hypothetical protein Q7U48_17660 [Hydrogenophaga sp.]|nr:hypothetical protein [Hydrogenophaga sp.]